MPHAVLNGDAAGADLSRILSSQAEESVDWRIKVDEVYIERKGKKALLSTVVVEEGHPQSFYILVAKDDAGKELTIRLDPSTDPIKTRGVKRAVGFIAESILKENQFTVIRHNIQGYLRTDRDRNF